MTLFATMFLCFYVVRLELVSTVNDTIHNTVSKSKYQSILKLDNLYGKPLSDSQYYLTITFFKLPQEQAKN